MDLKAYIASGVLELYALNQLSAEEASKVDQLLAIHEELCEELAQIYGALENYAKAGSIQPREQVETDLISKLANLKKEEIMNPLDLPLIDKYTEYLNWINFAGLMNNQLVGEDVRKVKVLTKTEKVTQLLVTSTTDFEWETHDHENESFLILSGQALCTIGSHTILMSPGDFMDIPLHIPHEVKLVSTEVTAILQRIAI